MQWAAPVCTFTPRKSVWRVNMLDIELLYDPTLPFIIGVCNFNLLHVRIPWRPVLMNLIDVGTHPDCRWQCLVAFRIKRVWQRKMIGLLLSWPSFSPLTWFTMLLPLLIPSLRSEPEFSGFHYRLIMSSSLETLSRFLVPDWDCWGMKSCELSSY